MTAPQTTARNAHRFALPWLLLAWLLLAWAGAPAALAQSAAAISGTVTLQGWKGTGEPTPQLTFTLVPAGSSPGPFVTVTQTPTPTAAPPCSTFTYTLTGLAPGAYTLAVKGPLWLRAQVSVDASGGSATGANVTLPAGDATGNDVVDSADLGVVRNAYNTVKGGARFNAAADLNGDGVVDSADLGLVRNSYNTVGVPTPPFSLTLSPASVAGGTSSSATLALGAPAPAGGLAFSLGSDSAAAMVPSGVTVPAGASGATFPVTTGAVSAATAAHISASSGGFTATAALTVNPAAMLTAPFDLSVYATGSGRVALYWTPVSGATGYNVYRGTAAGGEDYAHPVNGATPVNTPSYAGSGMDMFTDTGLMDGTEYFYTIEAVNGSASSQASNEDSDVPDPAAVPWDGRSPAAILSTFKGAFANETANAGTGGYTLRVVGPDNTIYDDRYASAQSPDGTVSPGTNVLTRPDGTTQTLADDDGQWDNIPVSSAMITPRSVGTSLNNRPANGPFRRVRTLPSYRGESGTVFLPSPTLTSAAQTGSGDSPQIFLGIGGGGSVEVDAGLQYSTQYSSWELFMNISHRYVGVGSKYAIPAAPLENDPRPGSLAKIPSGSMPIMTYWAWGTYPGRGRAKYSLLLVDDTNDGNIAGALGAPSSHLGKAENIRAKRVHAIAETAPGVTNRTGTSVSGAVWEQGSVILPDTVGTFLGWSVANGVQRYEDGSYQGQYGSVSAYETSPYIQEDSIVLNISP